MTLLTCTNRLFYIQCRQSRHSVTEFRKRKSLLNVYRIDRTSNENENVNKKLELPLNELVPVTPRKTSITIDVLDRETYSQLSEWRKQHLVRRARRVLPLPISLTTDDKLGYRWKQQYIKSLKKRNISTAKNPNDNSNELIPEFVRLMNNTNEELLKEKFPEIYEKFKSIRQSISDDNNVNELVNVDKPAYFPFSQMNSIQSNELLDPNEKPHREVGFNDDEYENFLKHNELLQFLASNIKGGSFSEYEPEIRGWASQLWIRNYGSSDPSIAPSKTPCKGCGAHLHCTSSNIPGFMPAQKFTLFNEKELETQRCQRCEFLTKYNVSLNVTVSDEEYPNLIAKINSNKSLVIILVDLLDFPCSVWPGIVNLIGEKHSIYIVGNKVDLLPKDDRLYLERIKKSLKESLKSTHISREAKIRD
ncbi:50S ribosome-binding GTPase-like protein, partial [Euroglyphus maynei]